MDIANLQIKVDSSQVKQADKNLEELGKESTRAEKSVNKLGKTARGSGTDFGILEKSIFTVKNLIGTVLVGSVISFADEMRNLSARVQNSTQNLGEFEQAWAGLNSVVMETGGSLSSAVEIFQRLSFTRTEIGATVDEMIQFTGTVQKLGVVSGASTGALNAGLLQLGQALSSDIARAEEFNSIMENIPVVGQAIAEEFGVTTGQLRQLIIEGEVLSKDIFAAILNQTEKANEQFDKMPMTIGRATSMLINQFKVLVSGIDDATGATEVFSGLILKVAEAVKGLQFLIVGFIKSVETLITAAVAGVVDLINKTIGLLNRLPGVDIGLVAPGLRQEAIADIQQNFIELAQLNDQLFGDSGPVQTSQREISKNYEEIAATLTGVSEETKKTAQSQNTLKNEVSETNKEFEKQKQLADSLQSSFESAFEAAVFGANSLSDVLKSLATDIQKLLFRQALSGLGQGDFFNTLAGGITGFFNTGTLPGFANGGSFMVGGLGGIDNNILSVNGVPRARVSSGERINISNNDPSTQNTGGGVTIMMNINTPDADSFRKSQGQILKEANMAANRAMRRNG